MQNLISIIVPVYMVERYINRCIDSLISQTYHNIEIILIDDGSRDNCSQICDYYGSKDHRVKVIHKANGGLSDARNVGMQMAEGDYFLFVDSDDYIEKDACEAFIQIAQKTDADIVVANALQEENGKKIKMFHTNLQEGKVYTNEEYMLLAIEARELYAPVWMNMYKSSLFKNRNLEFKKGYLHEDMQILPGILFGATRISFLDKVFYHYMIREGSIMNNSKNYSNGLYLMDIYKEWKEEFNLISNGKLQKMLYGYLAKLYLHTVREFHMNREECAKSNLDNWFLIKYGLDKKEKVKAIFYSLLPDLYSKID